MDGLHGGIMALLLLSGLCGRCNEACAALMSEEERCGACARVCVFVIGSRSSSHCATGIVFKGMKWCSVDDDCRPSVRGITARGVGAVSGGEGGGAL